MKKLLTIILVLIILVAGGVGGGMYWFGMGLETSYQQALKQTGIRTGMILKSSGFTKSFIASQANTLVMIPGVHATATIKQAISPGPIAITNIIAGKLDYNPIKYLASGTIKINAKKTLTANDKKIIGRLPLAKINVRSDLLSGGNIISITVPAFRGKVDGTNMSWPQTTFKFEANDQWGSIKLVSGNANLKLPARVVENLIRLRIHLDIEELKSRRKLSPAEIKKLSPAASRIAVANALPGYIERYGIRNVLDNAKSSNQPLTVIFRPGQIKVGGVTLPR